MSAPARSHSTPPGTGGTLIRLEGRDALALLHRLSTQALENLAAGEVRFTLFCDFRGRLLHRAAVLRSGDGTVWLAREDVPAAELIEHLERHLFREDVRIVEAGGGLAIRAIADASRVPRDAASPEASSPGEAGVTGRVTEEDGAPRSFTLPSGWSYRIGPDAARAADAAEERVRIRAGQPRHGHEIDPDFTPFEVGLAREVHLSKGCFTGQEALMRLVTYSSVRRSLALVGGGGDAPQAPLPVRRGGETAGRLTSATAAGSGWIGLAVLRRDATVAAGGLEIEGGARLESISRFPEPRPLGLP
jgi:folate-binding protein YgfZ